MRNGNMVTRFSGVPKDWSAVLPKAISSLLEANNTEQYNIAEVFVRAAAKVFNLRSINEVTTEQMLDTRVEYEVYRSIRKSEIIHARKIAEKLGSRDLFRGKYRHHVHPLVRRWVDEKRFAETRRYNSIYDCMRFLDYVCELPEFRRYAPYEFPVSLLQRRHMVSYRQWLLARVQRSQVKGWTERSSLGSVVRWIRWIQTNLNVLPNFDLTGITIPKSKHRDRDIPDDSTLIKLIRSYLTRPDHMGKVIYFLVAIASGARPVELLRLTTEHLDHNNQAIWLQSKGGDGRWIPLPPSVWVLLLKYIALAVPADGKILRNRARVMQNDVIMTCLKQRRKEGIHIDGAVALRHRFATDCLFAELPSDIVSAMLGHKNPEQLMVYQHSQQKLLSREVTRAFEGWPFGQ